MDDRERNADRYEWLRRQNWHDNRLFVVAGGKKAVRLGVDCPSGQRLDEAIDAAMGEAPLQPLKPEQKSAVAVSRQAVELLEDLVVALNRTHWSSWQTRHSFYPQQEAAEEWLKAIGRKTE